MVKMKKAQLKIQQMVFMLLAVTLLFVLVGLFVLSIQVSNIKNSAGSLEERNALLLVAKLANSPEFSCGESFGTGKINCVDADKVMALKKNINKYEDFWDVENIQIRKLYPSNEIECTLNNYPDCGLIKIREGNLSSEHSVFVTLCRKDLFNVGDQNEIIYDKCELAKLMVSYD